MNYMITSDQEITAWFVGRLPEAWVQPTPPSITVDREELTVIVSLEAPNLGETASTEARGEAAAGRIAAWRSDTREARIAIASEAQRRFERKVSWGAAIGESRVLFTHLSVPVMTRLRQPQRRVLDTLVEAGVARSRADALQWCVRLVGEHTEDWLSDLRAAMEKVAAVRDQGPGV